MDPEKKNIKSLSKKELEEYLRELGEPKYRRKQIFTWLFQKMAYDFNEFTDLPKALRQRLASDLYIGRLEVKHRAVSSDGTVKFLLKLEDGLEVETVLIPDGKRRTVCVSSQVGCALGCTFCATGTLGFKRNLAAWEIVEQVLIARQYLRDIEEERDVTNVVFMGMGEPLLNLDAVLQAIHILNHDRGPNIGARKITVSTLGILEGIYRLADSPIQFKLALSLHSAIQEKREKIMPLAKRVSLKNLKKAIAYFYLKKRRWVTLEYIHLPGYNDTEEDILALEAFIGTLPVKINVIPYNPYPGGPFRSPTPEEFEDFIRRLRRLPWTVTPRKPRGRDIFGACGQLFLHVNRAEPVEGIQTR